MDQFLFQHASQNPDSIAIEDDSRTLTYHELDSEVEKLALALKQFKMSPEEPVCILEGVGSEMIIAQLAVIRARLTCVPLDPSMPEMRIADMLNDIGAKYVLTDENAFKHEDMTFIPISGHANSSKSTSESYPEKEDPNHEYRSHILYTSGSSGKPKAVQLPERSILHLATNTSVTPLQPADHVAVINNSGFDISLFEVFATLVAGARMVIVPRVTVTDPFAFREFVARKDLSVIFMTAALFAITAQVCPNVFRGVRLVLTAGEVANVVAMRAVLDSPVPPQALWNTYGPTETTTYSTMHRVTTEEFNHDNVSIGKPVGDTKLLLVDEQMNTITKPGETGEILIAGPGMTVGYINRPQQNQDCFVTLDGVKYYRTGDLAKWRPSDPDVLEFGGRSDLQVKQGGFRVEPGEIEQLLLSSGWLSGTVVVQILPRDAAEEPYLVVFAIPAIADVVHARDIFEYLKQRLPGYMVPRDVMFCPEFPLTDHSKVNRKVLMERYLEKQDEKAKKGGHDGQLKDMASVVRNLLSSLLNRSSIQNDDDFFLLGGTSLQSAALIGKLREKLDKTMSMRSLHENSRFEDLISYLDEFAEGGNAPEDADDWAMDALLADNLDSLPEWTGKDEGRIFVTGITGFVGAYFLNRFLQMPEVKEIVGLARPKNSLTPSQRVERTLGRYDLWETSSPHMHKLVVLDGDITLDHLNLTPEKFTWLTNWASTVFHLAAKVNFCEPYHAHFDANVLGTKNVLEAALNGRRKSFHYMSSIDTWGPTGMMFGTRKLLEDGPLEPHVRGLPFDIGYAQSKWVSEKMVRRARERGLPTAIYRPGFIVGDSVHGSGNPDDFFARVMVGSIQLGAFPKLPNQRMEYVTIDYVLDATMHIASQNKNLGKSYSLVAPDPANSVNLEKTFSVIRDAGYNVEHIPYWDWVHRLQNTTDDNPLLPVMPLLQEPVLGGLSRFETSRNTPHYDSSNTVAALKEVPDIEYLPFTPGMLNKFLHYWDRKGFYSMPGLRN